MLRTGLVLDRRFCDHRTPPGHPERPERLGALCDALDSYERDGLVRVEPRPASEDELRLNHPQDHLRRVAALAGRGGAFGDGETFASRASYQVARLAAGGVLQLVDLVMAGEIDNGFALVRPPGHHAEPARAMGFCLFNHVAVAARYLQAQHGLARVLILDWDVHHGNGTEASFYDEGSVLYASLHQFPHYPGTGRAEDVGRGAGEGFTVNVPLPAGCGDGAYLAAFERVVLPIARQFDPQFVLVSAGFDPHARDPLGGMNVSESGFAAMAQRCLMLARERCDGRLVAVLEGGYDLEGLTASAARVLDQLGRDQADIQIPEPASSLHALHRVNAIQACHWDLRGYA